VSRSYCHPYALVAWHSGPVGVDIERVVACPEEFSQAICTPDEKAGGRWITDGDLISLWSSKEALSKHSGTRSTTTRAGSSRPRRGRVAPGGPWRSATQPAPGGHCAWVCWRETSPRDRDAETVLISRPRAKVAPRRSRRLRRTLR
jgi:phosphopantetheinyl transferase